jgi:hypothetical protein
MFPLAAATKKQRLFLKVTSGALAFVFFSTQVVAAPYVERNFMAERRQALKRSEDRNKLAALPLEAPLEKVTRGLGAGPAGATVGGAALSAGWTKDRGLWPAWLRCVAGSPVEIREVRLAGPLSRPGRVVYHLQDVHEQAEAQRNISRALADIRAANPVLPVGLEGARGAFRLRAFRALPDAGARSEIASALVEKGLLSGAEHLALTAETEPDLWGVESAELYRAHVDAFRGSLDLEPAARGHARALDESLLEAARAVYTPELRDWDALRRRFESSGEGLSDYVELLGRFVPGGRFPQVDLFRRSLEIERSLSFEQVESERRAALEELAARLPEAALAGLVRLSLDYRLGRLTYARFYSSLRETAAAHGLPLEGRFPALAAYVRYVSAAEGIEPDRFFAELESLEEAALKRLLAGAAQKEAYRLGRDVSLLKRLTERTLDEAGWRLYVRRRDDVRRAAERLARLRSEAGLAPRALPDFGGHAVFEAFYEAAEARNAALADNLLARMAAAGAPAAALVAGGFHTPGLTSLL